MKNLRISTLITILFFTKSWALTPQTISFSRFSEILCTDSVLLEAQSSAGLAVQFQIISGNGVVSTNYFKPNGYGTVILRAFQLGDAIFDSAKSIIDTFTVRSVYKNEATKVSLKRTLPFCISEKDTISLPSILGINYKWQFQNGNKFNESIFAFESSNANQNIAGNIGVFDGFCKLLTIDFDYKIYNKPIIDFQTTKNEIYTGDTLFLNTNPKGGNFNSTNVENNIYKAGNEPKTDSIIYTYSDTNRCSTSVKKVIEIKEKTEIQNPIVYQFISPNNDDKNDYFKISNLQYYTENELVIYNKWNNELYRQKNYDNKWSPTNFVNGMYYYEFIDTVKNKSYKGYFYVSK